MRSLIPLFVFAGIACGPPPTGALSARVSRDSALATTFTTEDGWTLKFTYLVIGVSGVTANGTDATGFPTAFAKPKVIDLVATASADIASNGMATPAAYDTISLQLGRTNDDENVNVPTDVLTRMGQRPLWVEGTASKQSTTRTFQLGLSRGFTFGGCAPAVTLEPSGSASFDFVVRAQHLFEDDEGNLRFDAWGLADTTPADTVVLTLEAQAVMLSSLPPSQYGATTGNLMTLFEKRALEMVALNGTGTCTGQ